MMDEKLLLVETRSSDENKSGSEYQHQKIIGFSELGRPLKVVFIGNDESNLRIFVIAGQHGDESNGRKSVLRLASMSDKSHSSLPTSVQLAILLDANPDGSSAATRENSSKIDLNRDHQRLEAKETRAIHDFTRLWRPHLIIDVHNYPPRRKNLIAENHIIDFDVFLDTPTNPAVDLFQNQEPLTQDLVRWVGSDLDSKGFSCERYLLFKSSGKARRSTLDVTDARNSLALSYDSLTILLEGRNPTKLDDIDMRENLLSAQTHALCSIIKWAKTHAEILRAKSKTNEEGSIVPIRYKYYPSDKAPAIKYRNALTGQRETVSLQSYSAMIKISKSVKLPKAYAVPQAEEKTLEILERHGFHFELPKPSQLEEVEVYSSHGNIEAKSTSQRVKKRIDLFASREKRILNGYRIFRTDQLGGRALAVFLEPESKYGLVRYSNLNLSLSQKPIYPILRVL